MTQACPSREGIPSSIYPFYFLLYRPRRGHIYVPWARCRAVGQMPCRGPDASPRARCLAMGQMPISRDWKGGLPWRFHHVPHLPETVSISPLVTHNVKIIYRQLEGLLGLLVTQLYSYYKVLQITIISQYFNKVKTSLQIMPLIYK